MQRFTIRCGGHIYITLKFVRPKFVLTKSWILLCYETDLLGDKKQRIV